MSVDNEIPNGFEILFSSDLDYENMVVQIEREGEFIALLSHEPNSPKKIEWPEDAFFEQGKSCDLREFLKVIEVAEKKLEEALRDSS